MRGRTIVALLFLSLPGVAQHGSSTVVNPYNRPEDLYAGAKLYRGQCAGCHGLEGAGTGTGPSLTSGTFRHGNSDEALFQSISKGVLGTPMPAFSAFSGLQIWQLVTHIRSLAVSRSVAHTKGDPKAGAAAFRDNCSGCHTVGPEGGLTGPDLSAIGSKRTGPELRQAITDPHADVPSEYWTVSVKTKKGESLGGTRLNEDTHSLQILDTQGRLVSVLKRDIAESELNRKSRMPAFTGKLSEQQIDNIVAYLTRLRGEQQQ
jgi:putative heme-binding domain-containing protein